MDYKVKQLIELLTAYSKDHEVIDDYGLSCLLEGVEVEKGPSVALVVSSLGDLKEAIDRVERLCENINKEVKPKKDYKRKPEEQSDKK